jgi:hypothetical protein
MLIWLSWCSSRISVCVEVLVLSEGLVFPVSSETMNIAMRIKRMALSHESSFFTRVSRFDGRAEGYLLDRSPVSLCWITPFLK